MNLSHLTFARTNRNRIGNPLSAKWVLLGLCALMLGARLQAQEPAPVFAPAGGVLNREMRVQVSSTDSQATIRYTTNGVDPTASDKVIASGSNVLIPRDLVLKAKAWNGAQTSTVTSGTFWPASAIAARGQHGTALRFNGEVFGWGVDSSGQLGDGGSGTVRSTPVFVLSGSGGPHLTGALAVAAGLNHTLVITGTEGSVYAFGDNSNGQIAQSGTSVDGLWPILVTGSAGAVFNDVDWIAAGDNHSLAIKSDGSLWAWGRNTNGSIGIGNTTTPQKSPMRVLASGTYPGGVPFGPVSAVAGGADHSVAISATDASVWAWGLNSAYQLGDNTKNPKSNPGRVQTLVSGSLVPLTGATQVSCGGNFTLALKADGSVWAWGNNSNGQIGVGTSGTANNQRVAGAVQLSGTSGNPLTGVVAVAAGDTHSLALNADGTVLAWGNNTYGQCGDGTSNNNKVNPVVVKSGSGVILQNIVAISAGLDFSMAMSSDGLVYTWGRPASGQLGSGTTTSTTSAYATQYSTIPQVSKSYPTITMQPISGTWIVPTTIQLTASASDPDGFVRRIDFLGNDSLLSSSYTYGAYAGANYMWNATAAGTYSIRAVATDLDGASGSSSTQTVTVVPPTVSVATQANYAVEPGGSAPNAQFKSPWGLTVDAAGNVYVADLYNFVIRKIAIDGNVSTVAGSPGVVGYADGFGSYAQFNNPRGVAADGNGNVYVADTINDTIRKITPDGTVSTFAGSVGSAASFDGTGTHASFNQPVGVAADANGNVYVADTGNCTIRKITASGTVTTLAGSPGLSGSTDGSGSSARFSTYASALAVDASGNVYVADSNSSTIRKITAAGAVSTLAGSPGLTGTTDGLGASARFTYPEGIAVDASGNVYVTDLGNSTIRKISPAGAVSTFAGSPGVSGTADGTGSSARFSQPIGVALDASGNIFVADNGIVRKVTPNATVSTLAGSPGISGYKDTVGSFRITRNFTSAPPNVPLVVSYAMSGSAAPGTDYLAPSGLAVIPSGQAYVDVPITPLGDMLADGPESVTLTLNSQTPYLLGSASSATLTILDNPPTVGVSKTADAEYDSNLAPVPGNFRFTRTGPLGALTVGYSVISAALPGIDYLALSGTVVFPQNVSVVDVPVTPILQGQASKDLAISITQDLTYAILSGSGRSMMRLEMPTGKITGGGAHVLALKFNGSLQSWGQQANGRLGNNATATAAITNPQSALKLSASGTFSDAIAIAAGADHSLAIDKAGNVYSFGNNNYGQLGNNTVTGTAVAIQVLTGTAVITPLGGSVAVASGSSFSLALSGTGAREVMAWGINNDGRLGNTLTTGSSKTAGFVKNASGSHLSRIERIAAGDRFGLALDATGMLWSWGNNSWGQLGDGTATSRASAQQVRQSGTAWLSDVMEIGAGVDFSVAVRRNATEMSTVWCWGQQSLGRLGNTLTTSGTVGVPTPVRTGADPVLSGTLQNIIQVACGPAHTLALDVSGTVWTWGANAYGQLGDGTSNARGYAAPVTFPVGSDGLPPSIIYVGAGGVVYSGTLPLSFSYAISKTGQVYSWGYNAEGELGISGSTFPFKTPRAAAGATRLAKQSPVASGTSIVAYDGVPVTIQLPASDPDGYPLSFIVGNALHGTTSLSAGNVTYTPAAGWSGTDSFQYTVSNGLLSASNTVTISVLLRSVNVAVQVPSALESGLSRASWGQFDFPTGVAVDNGGNLYVTDGDNMTVRKLSPSGLVSTVAGLPNRGGSSDGTGSDARFYFPVGAATDSSGNLYVADSNDTIRKITPDGVVTTLAGSPGQSSHRDGTGSEARFCSPRHPTVDPSGNIYVADWVDHTVRKITPDGVVTTLAGLPGVSGSSDGIGSSARFNSPEGAAVDTSGNVFVADTINHRIRKITPAGVVTTLSGTFTNPYGVAVDPRGSLYVLDVNSTKIIKISPDGTTSDLTGAQFNSAWGIAVDGNSNVYVADSMNHRICKVTPDGAVSTLAGTLGVSGSMDGITAFTGSNGVIRVSRSNMPLDVNLSINYTLGGTATPGVDYSPLPNPVVIPAGSSFVDIPVTPLSHPLAAVPATVVLTLAPQSTYTVGPASSGTVYLFNAPLTDAPTGLTALSGTGQINLSWQAVPGAVKYQVFRSTHNPAGFYIMDETKGTSYTDVYVVTGTTYYYEVRALNEVGASPLSAQASSILNGLPVATGTTVTANAGGSTAIPLSAVDPEGSQLIFAASEPGHGSVVVSGSVATYTPSAGYFGPDSFTFRANDGYADSNIATVQITVNGLPVASGTSIVTDVDQAIDIPLLASDPEGAALTFVPGSAAHGTVTVTGSSARYQPSLGFAGLDSFAFTASDGLAQSNTATVSIRVNAPPVASGEFIAAIEDTPVAVVISATDPDNSDLSYFITQNPAHGVLSGSSPNLIYTPSAGYLGADSFAFKANDGRLNSNEAVITISVKTLGAAQEVGSWNFEEGQNSIAHDSSGNGNDGVLEAGDYNQYGWSAGVYGGGVAFGGGNGAHKMTCADAPSLNLGHASFSASLWFNVAPGIGSVVFIDKSTSSNDPQSGKPFAQAGYYVGMNEGGQIETRLGGGSNIQNSLGFRTEKTFSDAIWHHALVVFDQTQKVAQIYLDGTPCELVKNDGTGGDLNGQYINFSALSSLNASATVPLVMGNPAGFVMDEVRIVSRAMTADDAKLLSDSDRDGLPDGWEISHFGNLDQSADGDWDGDGLSNYAEYLAGTSPTTWDSDGDGLSDSDEINVYHTNPLRADSDGDGMLDGWEVSHGLNPLVNDAALDPDQDGLSNLQEYLHGTDPHNPDTDGDGLSDGDEVNTYGTNPNYPDSDWDGLSDADEVLKYHTNPNAWDTDGDGMNDGWEIAHGLNPLVDDANSDPDHDGLTNLQEYYQGCDPLNPDTDGDGLSDGDEVLVYHTNPFLSDTDGDGLSDYEEIFRYGTNPNRYDTDGDGLPDGFEVKYPATLNALVWNDPNGDPDHDGLTNLEESYYGTDPGNPDSDGDGTNDGAEIAQGSNPNDPSDGGRAPNPEEKVTVSLSLGPGEYDGDQEDNFQVYTMIVTDLKSGKVIVQFTCNPPDPDGTAHTKTISCSLFRTKRSYSIEVRASQPDASSTKDFDYHAEVNGGSYLRCDPDQILGSHEQDQNGSQPFPQLGKLAYLIYPKLQEIYFGGDGNVVLHSDNDTISYDPPQWVAPTVTGSTVTGGTNYAVAYQSSTVPSIGASLDVPSIPGQSLMVKVEGDDGIFIPPTTLEGSALPATLSGTSFSNKVQFYDNRHGPGYHLHWYASADDGDTWLNFENTQHQLYVTLSYPVTSYRQETLFYIGCKDCQGILNSATNSWTDVTQKIWADVSGRNVKRVDDQPLAYYRSYLTQNLETGQLLAGVDGQCGSWAKFFIDLRRAQGLSDVNQWTILRPTISDGFFVNNWVFSGTGSSKNSTFPYVNVFSMKAVPGGYEGDYTGDSSYSWLSAEVNDAAGIEGQNNDNPASIFGNHQVVPIGNTYYDPSYGATYEGGDNLAKALPLFQTKLAGFYIYVSVTWTGTPIGAMYIQVTPPNLQVYPENLPY